MNKTLQMYTMFETYIKERERKGEPNNNSNFYSSLLTVLFRYSPVINGESSIQNIIHHTLKNIALLKLFTTDNDGYESLLLNTLAFHVKIDNDISKVFEHSTQNLNELFKIEITSGTRFEIKPQHQSKTICIYVGEDNPLFKTLSVINHTEDNLPDNMYIDTPYTPRPSSEKAQLFIEHILRVPNHHFISNSKLQTSSSSQGFILLSLYRAEKLQAMFDILEKSKLITNNKVGAVRDYITRRDNLAPANYEDVIVNLYEELEITREVQDFTATILAPESPEIRGRIAKKEFLKELLASFDKEANKNEEKIKNIITKIREREKADKKEQLISSSNEIEYMRQTLFDLLDKRDKLLDEVFSHTDYIKEEDIIKINRVLKNPLINFYTLKGDSYNLAIHTEPITLSYDMVKATKVDKIKNLKEGEALGIGRHIINVNLKSLRLEFIPVGQFRNYHIQDYSCYGTFEPEFVKARGERNLPRIINLALQILGWATIGDPPGDRTISRAYVIKNNSLVVDGQREIFINDYLGIPDDFKNIEI